MAFDATRRHLAAVLAVVSALVLVTSGCGDDDLRLEGSEIRNWSTALPRRLGPPAASVSGKLEQVRRLPELEREAFLLDDAVRELGPDRRVDVAIWRKRALFADRWIVLVVADAETKRCLFFRGVGQGHGGPQVVVFGEWR